MLKTQYLYNLETEIKPYLFNIIKNNEKIRNAKSVKDIGGNYLHKDGSDIKITVTDTTISISKNVDDKSILLEKIYFNINCSI